MKLNVDEFQNNLNKLSKVIQRKPNLLVLNNVLLTCNNGYLYLTGTDGVTIVKVAQRVNSDLTVLVNYHELVSLLKSHKNYITLSVINKKLNIKSEKAKTELSLIPIEEYPNVVFKAPDFIDVDPVHFENGVNFFSKLAKVGEYVEIKDFTKIIYKNVFTDGGSRICVFKHGLLDIPIAVLPVLKGLAGGENVKFGTDDFAIYFKIDNVLIKTSRIVLEKYPNYQSVIPTTEYELVLPRKEVIDNLTPLLLIDPDCHISIDNSGINFLVKNTHTTKSEFTITTNLNTVLYFKVVGKAFLDILRYLNTDEVVIKIGALDRGMYLLTFFNEDFEYHMVTLQ